MAVFAKTYQENSDVLIRDHTKSAGKSMTVVSLTCVGTGMAAILQLLQSCRYHYGILLSVSYWTVAAWPDIC